MVDGEAVALPSILVFLGLGAGVPLCLRARFGGTAGGRTGGAWAWKKGCVTLCSGLFAWLPGVGLGSHKDPMFPVEDPPLGVRFKDVDGGTFRGCVNGVPWSDGYFHLGGLEVQGGPAAEEVIDVEGPDRIFAALRWSGHCRDCSGVPVVFAGGEGVEGGRDYVLGFCVQDDVALRAGVYANDKVKGVGVNRFAVLSHLPITRTHSCIQPPLIMDDSIIPNYYGHGFGFPDPRLF